MTVAIVGLVPGVSVLTKYVPKTWLETWWKNPIIYCPYIPLVVTREEPEVLYHEDINPIKFDGEIKIWGQKNG